MTGALTFRDRTVAAIARWGMRPFLALPLPWTFHRRGVALMQPRARPRTPCRETWSEVAGVPVLTVAPPGARGTLLWLHGGGFVIGSPVSYRRMAHRLAERSGLRVALPRYRLAPEHPFPAAFDDAHAVAEAVANGRWWLGGDSAGGNLALGVLSTMLARGDGPEKVVLVSPAPNLDPGRPTPPGVDEMLLPETLLRRAVTDYLGGADPADPRVSPLRAAFPDAPPILIQCARREFLEADIDALAAHLRAEGAAVRVEKADGLPHDYQIFAGLAPAADRAVDDMAAFLKGPA